MYRNATKYNADGSLDCEIEINGEWYPHTLEPTKKATRQIQTGLETVEIEPAILDEDGGELVPAKTEERPVYGTEEYSPYDELLAEAEAAGVEIAPYERPQAEIEAEAKEAERAAKLKGFEYEGVWCSVHKEDQWGLASVESAILGGVSMPFYFKNGNVLMLTPDNFSDFKSAWMQCRATFFGVEL